MKEVQSFVSGLSTDNYPRPDSFRFADLHGSGRLSLVLFASGYVEVIDQNSHAATKRSDFKRYVLMGRAAARDASSIVQDLDRSGRLELVFEHTIPQHSSHCDPHWPVIYAWTGADYEDVSHRFKHFYEKRLPEIRRTLAAIEAAKQRGAASGASDEPQVNIGEEQCVEAVAAKFQRVIGVSPDAGLDDAIKWSQSHDVDDRDFAISILRDIGTPKAFEQLHRMTSDPDEHVANFAEEIWKDSPEAQKEMHTPPPLLKADWSTTATPSLATRPPSKAAVAALMAYADNLKEGAAASSLPQDEDVESFRFVNLRGTDVLSLVIEGAPNERLRDYSIEILDKTPTGLERYSAGVAPGPDEVDAVVQDLDGDGRGELVIDGPFIEQCEACCNPTIPAVYAWTGANYENVSKRFPRFYQRRIHALQSADEALSRKWSEIETQRKLALAAQALRLNASPTRSSTASKVRHEKLIRQDCRKIEIAKMERVLGYSPDAGLDYAIALSKSDDWRDRRLAAKIFADIGTAVAMEHLRALSGDPDNAIALWAKTGRVPEHYPPPTEIPER